MKLAAISEILATEKRVSENVNATSGFV